MMKKLSILFLLFLMGCSTPAPKTDSDLQHGIVSAASPEAAQAGMDILKAGGNAIDAAVAISFALGVTEPAMSGLGGGSQVLFAPSGQVPIAINGTTFSPAATPVDATEEDLQYHTRTTIPSTVKVMEYIWEKYGSGNISWSELLQPAIEYAEEGFVIGLFRHMVYKKYESALKKSPFYTSFVLMPDGNIPAPGDTLRQPLLAQTLRRLAQAGAEDFYSGEIAQQIAKDMRQNGGWISLEDLQNFPEPVELQPLSIDYRGYQVYSQPPPCGGWTALLMLNVLQESEADQLQYDTEERFLALTQALALGHQDRKERPITDLIDYEQAAKEKFSRSYAHSLLANSLTTEVPETTKDGETTHFSVVDKEGNAVAVTASINAYFGARAASPELGFLYNTYMDDFFLGQPDHPFAIRPGAMAYSSMSPTIVQREGDNVLVIGSPGSARIISAVAQLTQLWIDSDLGIEQIVGLPRLHSVNGRVYIEDMPSIPNDWVQQLRDRGYEIAYPTYDLTSGALNAYFGGIHALAKEEGGWKGAADPRRDGEVINE
jgi:gamma-glutamyltranspeptidase/glutathione hydrolase